MSSLYKEHVSSLNGRYYSFGLGEVFGDSLLPIGQDRPESIRLRNAKKITKGDNKVLAQPQQKIHFFDLPAEVRNIIYGHLFDGDDKVDCIFTHVASHRYEFDPSRITEDRTGYFSRYVLSLQMLKPSKRVLFARIRLPAQIRQVFVSKQFVNEATSIIADNFTIGLLAAGTFEDSHDHNFEKSGAFSAHEKTNVVRQTLTDVFLNAKHIKIRGYDQPLRKYSIRKRVWPRPQRAVSSNHERIRGSHEDGHRPGLDTVAMLDESRYESRHGTCRFAALQTLQNLQHLTVEIRDFWWCRNRPGYPELMFAEGSSQTPVRRQLYTLFQYEQEELFAGTVPSSLSEILYRVLPGSLKYGGTVAYAYVHRTNPYFKNFAELPVDILRELRLGDSVADRIEVRCCIRLLCLAAIVRKEERMIDETPATIDLEVDYKTRKVHRVSWAVDESREIADSYSF